MHYKVPYKHWIGVLVNLRYKELVYLDSLGEYKPEFVAALRRWISDEARDKLGQEWDVSTWRVVTPDVRLQYGSLDCGVFTLLFANRLSLGRGFDFNQCQDHTRESCRVRVACELLDRHLRDDA